MKYFLISDNVDTLAGMRLVGVRGVVVHEEDEVRAALDKACADPDIGLVLITDKLVAKCSAVVFEYKLTRKRPLIVEMPDRHSDSRRWGWRWPAPAARRAQHGNAGAILRVRGLCH